MDERAVHARLHELYTRLDPETGDHLITWREAVRSLLEALEVQDATPPWVRQQQAALTQRLGLRTIEEVRATVGLPVTEFDRGASGAGALGEGAGAGGLGGGAPAGAEGGPGADAAARPDQPPTT